MFAEIYGKLITDVDISFIVEFKGCIRVRECYFDNKDLASTNPKILLDSCYFENSEAILPNPANQLHNCIFTGSIGVKQKRHPIRTAIKSAGYHTPVIGVRP
ncbi:hypothetical protein VpaJT1_34 [Vibrio phage VpaJT_1]|nr:hypothetical protein VpaJT1_34 [Vibrio phage VpaJT_1]